MLAKITHHFGEHCWYRGHVGQLVQVRAEYLPLYPDGAPPRFDGQTPVMHLFRAEIDGKSGLLLMDDIIFCCH